MVNRFVILLLASAGVVGMLQAQNATTIKKVPLSQTSPASGQEMFNTYCATCHGKDGKGGGPAASALKVAPTDLTQLSLKNQEKFPEDLIFQVLTYGPSIAAHGSEEMPIWGDLFKTLNPGRRDMVQLRIVNLTSYIKSIQGK
jgi:mono/diheme cytochrome c family protein